MELGGRRRGWGVGGEGGYSEGTGRIQWGYSESTLGYSDDTVRVHWGTVRVQSGYSGIRRDEERARRRIH